MIEFDVLTDAAVPDPPRQTLRSRQSGGTDRIAAADADAGGWYGTDMTGGAVRRSARIDRSENPSVQRDGHAPGLSLADDQFEAIAGAFGSLLGLLRDADPRDKAELYARIGLRMTYRPGPETMIAEVATPAIRVFDGCPRPDVDLRYVPAFTHDLMID